MADDVYTYYTLKGNLPEEFKKLELDMADSDVLELFGSEVEYNRWYISPEMDIELTDSEVHFCVWSAWHPEHDLWFELAKKYDLSIKYLSESEYPFYFDYYNEEDEDEECFKVFFEVEYDDDAENVLDISDYSIEEVYFTKEIPSLIKTLEQCEKDGEKYLIIHANDDAWYDDELLLEDYVYTLDDLKKYY